MRVNRAALRSAVQTIAIVLAALYALLLVVGWLFADRLMFFPPAASYNAADITRLPVGTGDTLALVHLDNPSARHTLLYSHGNAEDLGYMMPALEALAALGFSVVAYDYRGYGLSTGGPPTAAGTIADVEAVYRYVTETLRVPPGDVILYGRSVGSGPTLALAASRPVGAVVLEGAFTTPSAVVTRVRILPFDRFDNVANIRRVRAPVLIIHGTRDEVIPFGHGHRLYAAAQDPKRAYWVQNAGHNDLVDVAGEDYGRHLQSFAATITGSP